MSFAVNGRPRRPVVMRTGGRLVFHYASPRALALPIDPRLAAAERANNHIHAINLTVRLRWMEELSYVNMRRVAQGTDAEQAFFERYERGIRLPNVINGSVQHRNYQLARCRNQGVYNHLPAIVDFIAFDDQYWFPVEYKDAASLANAVALVNPVVGFRSRYQALALYVAGNRSIRAVDVDLEELERLPGMVIRREAQRSTARGYNNVQSILLF